MKWKSVSKNIFYGLCFSFLIVGCMEKKKKLEKERGDTTQQHNIIHFTDLKEENCFG